MEFETFIKLNQRGQITIPASLRKQLNLSPKVILGLKRKGFDLIISPLKVERAALFEPRLYSDKEIKNFLKDDELDPETKRKAERILERL